MRLSKKRLKKIINEEAIKLLAEITPGAAGQAAMGGLTPADQGFAAAEADDHTRSQRDELMDAIQRKFNLKHIRTSEEFDGRPDAVWISCESGDEASDGSLLFDYHAGDLGSYEFGVHKEFSDFVEPYGFFAEWYDPGTLMLYGE